MTTSSGADPVGAGKEAFCHIHNRMEPDGFWGCGECWHAWPTEADLLADLNATNQAVFGDSYPTVTEFDPAKQCACPLCTHDW